MSSSSSAPSGGGRGFQAAPAGHADSNTFTSHHFASFVGMEVPVTIVPRFSLDAVPRFCPTSSSKRGGTLFSTAEGEEEGEAGAGLSHHAGDTLDWRFGPFAPMYPVEVPLYVALYLVRTEMCTITLPDYLQLASLRAVLEVERDDPNNFQPLPFYFFEVSKLILDAVGGAGNKANTSGAGGSGARRGAVVGGDGEEWGTENVAETSRLVQEIRLVRQLKLLQHMSVFESPRSPMSIPGIKLTNMTSSELQFLRGSFAVVLQQAARLDPQQLERIIPAGRQPQPHGTSTAASSSMDPTSSPQRLSSMTRASDTTSIASGAAHLLDADTSFLLQSSQHTAASSGIWNTTTSAWTTTTGEEAGVLLSQSQDARVSTAPPQEDDVIAAQRLQPPPPKKRRILRQQ